MTLTSLTADGPSFADLPATEIAIESRADSVESSSKTINRSSAIRDELIDNIPHLRRYARFLLKSASSEMDDLVQQTLLKAIANLHQYQPGTNMRAWLFAILRNIYISDRRKASYRETTSLTLDVPAPASFNMAGQVEIIALKRAFASLTDEHREILTLVAIDGLDYESAAEILKIPTGTVRSRLFRARAALARLMDPPAPTPRRRMAAASLAYDAALSA